MSTITDATDSAVSLPTSVPTTAPVTTLEGTVENVDPIAASPTNRVRQQHVLPGAIKGRSVAILQQFATVDFKYALVPTGTSVIFSTITTNAQGNLLENFPAYQIYVGNDPTTLLGLANRMPEVISSLNYPFYTKESIYDSNNISAALSTNYKGIHLLQVRNNSGNTVWIGTEIYTKFIVNNSNAASN
jgi:hypothetical protein